MMLFCWLNHPNNPMSALRMRGLAALACFALGACHGADAAPRWTFEVDSGLAEQAVVLNAYIWNGGCSGAYPEYFRDQLRFNQGGPNVAPPHLPAGNYGFGGMLVNATCNIVAYGCVMQALPTDSVKEIIVELHPAEGRTCSADLCDQGRCGFELLDASVSPDNTP